MKIEMVSYGWMRTMECTVCCERFNKSNRKCVGCAYCEFQVCTACARQYLLQSLQDPHCMNCKRGWNYEFMCSNFTQKFMNEDWKKHRENMLLEREKSMLPAAQLIIEKQKEREAIMARIEEMHSQADVLDIQVRNLTDVSMTSQQAMEKNRQELKKVYMQQHDILGDIMLLRVEHDLVLKKKAPAAAFVRACPADNCRGFLSSQWKCGLCNIWVCPTCHEIKGTTRTEDHVCKPENVATAQQLAKDTKPCPKCASLIFKIDGCFAKDTPVLMWNGTTKMSQDICVGDILIGDDGHPRVVEDTCTGEDQLYEVSQRNGMTYIVNSKHKLALHFSGDRSIYWKDSEYAWYMRWFDHDKMTMCSKKSKVTQYISKEEALLSLENFKASLKFPDVIEITVADYLNLSPSCKKHLMGFKGSQINWPYQDTYLDPYMLGLYLGDGINNGVAFALNTSSDPEIMQYILNWCEVNDAELVHDAAYKFRIRRRGSCSHRLAIGKGSSSETCKGCKERKCHMCDLIGTYETKPQVHKANPLKTALNRYNLVQNKHIPIQYIVNDRATRLAVLAGMIDTDGYVSNEGKRVTIPQANQSLGRQFEFLAKSLGLDVNSRTRKLQGVQFKNSQKNECKDQLVLNISGKDLSEVKCLVERKKCTDSSPNKDWSRTAISVRPIGKGSYYGWCVSGNNKRFMLSDFTVVRNCDQMYCTQCNTAFSWRTGAIETKVIHNPHYYEYLRRTQGHVPRNPGDVNPCGRNMPYGSTIKKHMVTYRLSNETQDEILEQLRMCGHIQHTMLPYFHVQDNPNANEDLRIRYLQNIIDEQRFKVLIQQREKAKNKKRELHAVLDMYITVSRELFMKLLDQKSTKAIVEVIAELGQLKEYSTEQLQTIKQRYKCVVPAL